MSGIGPLQCPNDYLILANTRLCGTQLNADVTGTSNAEVYGLFNSIEFASNTINCKFYLQITQQDQSLLDLYQTVKTTEKDFCWIIG